MPILTTSLTLLREPLKAHRRPQRLSGGAFCRKRSISNIQYRLAEYGLQPADLSKVLGARNVITTGGEFETGQRRIIINPSGQFESRNVIGNVVVAKTSTGAPVYLRDLVKIVPGYQSPARYLNYYTWQDPAGHWRRSRAVTVAVYMRDQQQIAKFGVSVKKN